MRNIYIYIYIYIYNVNVYYVDALCALHNINFSFVCIKLVIRAYVFPDIFMVFSCRNWRLCKFRVIWENISKCQRTLNHDTCSLTYKIGYFSICISYNGGHDWNNNDEKLSILYKKKLYDNSLDVDNDLISFFFILFFAKIFMFMMFMKSKNHSFSSF